ncbi:DUF5828 family protein [Natranaeroarchaeum aerophilus]|uniref:DUF5828 family protein n=1 Tax=Natranaeroarchaeum aerophilus TaxID=2917711 RepID=A0AAE3K3E3_9EURY|nr:DUF5828 family protein [Natranaeroarchaeum aerophilus]MCL9812276.1 DUF5828 family protein [Natranaeroarchaeum aerophilus]
MEESISGFKIRGTWGDIVEHGERISRALRDVKVHRGDEYNEAFEEWDEWRPKSHERIEEDVSKKTADQASVAEGKGEQAGKNPDEDIKTAGEKLSESYEKLDEDDAEGAVGKWGESIDYVARAADSAGRKALRKVEDTVYQQVMTQLAPYYFDNALISANLQQSTNGNEEEFIFEVNVNDDGLKDDVSQRLAEYEDTIDRWHIDTEKETTVAEAVEGVEPPENDVDGRSKSTKN